MSLRTMDRTMLLTYLPDMDHKFVHRPGAHRSPTFWELLKGAPRRGKPRKSMGPNSRTQFLIFAHFQYGGFLATEHVKPSEAEGSGLLSEI